jgi:polysaccharide biosynthesis/export protein
MKTDGSRVVILTLLCGLSLSAQSRKAGDARDSEKPSPAGHSNPVPAKNQANTQDPGYVIGPDDLLDIRVFKEDALSLNSVRVRPDGKISVPLLNDIQADGLTPVRLGASIAEGLRKYLTDPKVTVIVVQSTGQRVFVVGEIGRQGSIPMLPGMTVVQAIAMSGGFSEYANRKGTYILRVENGKSTLLRFNYKKALRGDAAQNLELKDGDTIVVT